MCEGWAVGGGEYYNECTLSELKICTQALLYKGHDLCVEDWVIKALNIVL